jgi:hypothetical protein
MAPSSTSPLPLPEDLAALVSGRAWFTPRFGALAAMITGSWLVLEFIIIELALFGTPSLAHGTNQDPAVVVTALGLAGAWGIALGLLGRSGTSTDKRGMRVVWGLRTRRVPWTDVQGFVSVVGGMPGLWVRTPIGTLAVPSPLHQLSAAEGEERALRLNRALGVDPGTVSERTWTQVAQDAGDSSGSDSRSGPPGIRPSVEPSSEIAALLTGRAWDRSHVRFWSIAWCGCGILVAGSLAGGAASGGRDGFRPAQFVAVSLVLAVTAAGAWSILRRCSKSEHDGIVVVGATGRRWIPWSEVARFSWRAPKSGWTTGLLQIERTGASSVTLAAVPRREAAAAAELLNRSFGLSRATDSPTLEEDVPAARAVVPAGLTSWLARGHRSPVLEPGPEVSRLLTGRAWDTKSGKTLIAYCSISGFGFAILMLALALFDEHDRSRPAQAVTAAVFALATVGVLLLILRQRSTVDEHGIHRVRAWRTSYLRWSDIVYFDCLERNRIGAFLSVVTRGPRRVAVPTVFHQLQPSELVPAVGLLNEFLGAMPPYTPSSFRFTVPLSTASNLADPWADHRSGRRANGPPSDPAVRKLLVGNERQTRRFWVYTVPATLAVLGLAIGLAAASEFARVDHARKAQVGWSIVLTVGAVAVVWLRGRSGTSIDGRGLDKVVGFTHVRIPWTEVTGFFAYWKGRPGIYVQRNHNVLVRVPSSERISLDSARHAVERLNRACGLADPVDRTPEPGHEGW